MVIGISTYRFEHMRSALFVIVKVAFAGIVGCGLHKFRRNRMSLPICIGYAKHR